MLFKCSKLLLLHPFIDQSIIGAFIHCHELATTPLYSWLVGVGVYVVAVVPARLLQTAREVFGVISFARGSFAPKT